MKQRNQSGFSVVELLLIFIILTVIGFTGYRVYRAQQSSNESLYSSEQVSTQNAESNSGDTSTSSESGSKDVPKDWEEYSNPEINFNFYHPSSWTLEEEQYESKLTTINLRAPNTTVDDQAYYNVTAGAEIQIYKQPNSTYSNLEAFKSKDDIYKEHSSNKASITIDGTSAVQYEVAYEGPPKFFTVFFKDGQPYSISIETEAYSDDEYKEIYDSLINSISFN